MKKTFLVVWFNSEGIGPSKVTDRLLAMGFKPIHGNYDYVYDWGENADTFDIIRMGDRIQAALKGFGVMFKLETLDEDAAGDE